MEKTRLENFVGSFQINNETCVKIKQIVTQEIESVISNPRGLLRSALESIFESSRKHPGKLLALYCNRPSTTSSTNRNEQYPNRCEYNEEALETLHCKQFD